MGLQISGMSISQISSTINRSRRVIKNFLDLGKNYGLKNKGGPKFKLTPRENRMILREASNNNVSRAEIASNLKLAVSK